MLGDDNIEYKDDLNEDVKINTVSDIEIIDFQYYTKMSYTKLLQIAKQMNLFAGDKKSLLFDMLKEFIGQNKQVLCSGYLQIVNDSYGMLRDINESFKSTPYDIYVSLSKVKKYNMRHSDYISGIVMPPASADKKFFLLDKVCSVNNYAPTECYTRPFFDNLTADYPTRQVVLENEELDDKCNLVCRAIDLIVPIGFGSRGLLCAPPFTGKTTVIHCIGRSIVKNYPDAVLVILLVGERPEEVTDMKEVVPQATIIAATFDNDAQDLINCCEMTINMCRRMVESGKDVVVLMDSITRLVRSNNEAMPPSSKVLSGGVDAKALGFPRYFLGSARNTREAGSLTIIATSLVQTNSVLDEFVYQEFKGTGNWHLNLDREAFRKGIRPAIDGASGTRQYEKFVNQSSLIKRGIINQLIAQSGVSTLLPRIRQTKNNDELMKSFGIMPTKKY